MRSLHTSCPSNSYHKCAATVFLTSMSSAPLAYLRRACNSPSKRAHVRRRCRKRRLKWYMGEREQYWAVLERWRAVAEEAGPLHSGLARQLIGLPLSEARTILEDTLHVKAASTLKKRIGSFLIFARWARSKRGTHIPFI